jgi:DNA repair ATPase RecN
MKKLLVGCVSGIVLMVGSLKATAQTDEIAQLALDIEKLAQFKQILNDLKKGYDILFGGYNTIKNISKGNFELHKVFLDGLLDVSPVLKKYNRVAEIIEYQVKLVKEYKFAFQRCKENGLFNPSEIDYIGKVYATLFSLSLKNLDDLIMVTTSSKLRMSDDERLAVIDNIFADMQDKLSFLRSFNNGNALLAVQRQRQKLEVANLRQYYDFR